MYHEAKNIFCGYFPTELEAAQAINWKCVELNIALKNPEAGLSKNKPEVRFKKFKIMHETKDSKIGRFAFLFLEKKTKYF